MATYKVIQDIEAEDKLIGPLTLRQCIYGAIAVLAGYLSFLAISKHAGFLVIFFLPFMVFGGFFAFPWSREQPTEVWALAKLRFMIKPRRRIWNQSGIKELVTITVPKKIERTYTNGLTQTEVSSRLRALADTIDTRGWAVKNIDVTTYTQSNGMSNDTSDRLVDASALPREVPLLDDSKELDILDMQSNPVARQLDNLMTASADARRQKLTNDLHDAVLPEPVTPASQAPRADYWFLDKPSESKKDDDTTLMSNLKKLNARSIKPFAHLRTVKPLANHATTTEPSPQPAVTTPPTPATLKPVTNDDLVHNNDWNVATIAREAQRRNPDMPDEVNVPLR